MSFKIALLSVALLIHLVEPHARLLVPPARSSCWREFPSLCPRVDTDNELSCGGVGVQWQRNGGKCGICGDSWSGERRFEVGGSMYRGVIVRQYITGQTIDVTVQITSNHKGWFEYRICSRDGSSGDVTDECLNRNLLRGADGRTRFTVPDGVTGGANVTNKLVLPADLSCKNCVLQWKYHCGNSWGTDPNGVSCVGCGPQEEFYGCADVSISGNDYNNNNWNPIPVNTLKPSTTTSLFNTFASANSDLACQSDAKTYRDPANCSKFYQCAFAGTQFQTIYTFFCPAGTRFSVEKQICDFADQVQC